MPRERERRRRRAPILLLAVACYASTTVAMPTTTTHSSICSGAAFCSPPPPRIISPSIRPTPTNAPFTQQQHHQQQLFTTSLPQLSRRRLSFLPILPSSRYEEHNQQQEEPSSHSHSHPPPRRRGNNERESRKRRQRRRLVAAASASSSSTFASSSTHTGEREEEGEEDGNEPYLSLEQRQSARRNLLASFVLGAGAFGTLLTSILLRTWPLGHRAVASAAPLAATLIPYILCLTGGLPLVNVGSWKSLSAIAHRLGGVCSLILPFCLVIHEALTGKHASLPLYLATVATIASNLFFGAALIPSRFPAYDIPAARGLAVGTLYGWAFLGWSLTFRFGHLSWYGPIGKLFAVVALYGACFSWSDALQNMHHWRKGLYKTTMGHKWYLPFEPSTYRQVFGSNIYRQPTKEALQASLMTAWQGCLPTIFVALFGSSCLLQLAYLLPGWGPTYMHTLTQTVPGLTRWATYQALLAVAANNFGTFLVSLVVHNRLPLSHIAFYNFLVPLIPLLNIVALCGRYPGVGLPLIVRMLLWGKGGVVGVGEMPVGFLS